MTHSELSVFSKEVPGIQCPEAIDQYLRLKNGEVRRNRNRKARPKTIRDDDGRCGCEGDCGQDCRNKSEGRICDETTCSNSSCGGRVNERIRKQLKVEKTEEKGDGVFTYVDIPRETAVLTYDGYTLSRDDFYAKGPDHVSAPLLAFSFSR